MKFLICWFHQGMHCLLISSGSALFAKTQWIFRETITIFFPETLTSIYTMDHPDFIIWIILLVCKWLKQVKNSIPSGVTNWYDIANWYVTLRIGFTIAEIICLDRAGMIPCIWLSSRPVKQNIMFYLISTHALKSAHVYLHTCLCLKSHQQLFIWDGAIV